MILGFEASTLQSQLCVKGSCGCLVVMTGVRGKVSSSDPTSLTTSQTKPSRTTWALQHISRKSRHCLSHHTNLHALPSLENTVYNYSKSHSFGELQLTIFFHFHFNVFNCERIQAQFLIGIIGQLFSGQNLQEFNQSAAPPVDANCIFRSSFLLNQNSRFITKIRVITTTFGHASLK